MEFKYFIVTGMCAVNLVSEGDKPYTGIISIVQNKYTVQLFYRDRCMLSEAAKSYIGIILVV